MSKVLMKGNEAVGAAAIKAGCKYFFGYPITPQNEIPEYMSKKLPEVGGEFVQAESEVAAINMVYGAAGCGARVMTSSSSPGMALKQEGISYLVGAELPAVLVNMMRGGPGLGGIQPAQSDYFMSVKGGGNGDYFMPVYAPASIQETVDLIQEAFDVADQYRTPVMVIADGMIGQMMEPVEFKDVTHRKLEEKTWATDGTKEERKPNVINSLFLDAQDLEDHILKLEEKYNLMAENECRWEEYKLEGAEIVIAAYGTTARIVKNAIDILEKDGIKVGLIRPITLWPFPDKAFDHIDSTTKTVLTVEMSRGQMIEDVRLALNGKLPTAFYGRTGGVIPTPAGVVEAVKKLVGGAK
ncbi:MULTISPECIES: 3-methyl-2-oxobutanoate dehydrogenase subunit VorB [Psychrilyobacter]|uniref:3-methyl-2-oxobutanoate dehydrogenase subunit VorB n=1 Tax=Psychrilyobacter piezotolerans TaxID=2293438 RepID=A0ABX9KHF4_9FUSO|nr:MULTISPECIES: 3-methyl-2-oxobutanoate dehydrogenase subunit VorB [Psychrilyobacter]MCS5422326.1 3-methyl-2-oxobutanoate dehydrogenase subunit VorB [Psychrilyobacter sp. S5]NDI77941.1 3-methyl-2-oxobutanoate dehydrogenase subunit VorB [Psychrilyobacter piezotolerans]RDE62056.1 3-methyl-2-oxobutanoate dehydrogenase subunit VorB [Psychrilyobacter sp. S5]REI41303.1 3-methyl-2-oxobutanoate dehydrogenase subunit VorB [Psychrilyobacter piezotolerans]